ncbi:hypothetical protein CGLO_07505 [Colletotrichum gloeosporioides Cg-14]|uniref:Uncharacterized protein n=1 Tax=Colletotrichum gloeosporioides (strain Cg-14) TaxID=1237896 RepID=T0LWN2_COLGC|nr:hypothetical protein CGLO_07505 [Colletotrichum gloeosporioides Cg-14]
MAHKAFELQAGYVILDLPNFCDLTRYGHITEDEDEALCKEEARRLVKIANTDSPVRLQGKEDMLGPADAKGYSRLHWLGHRLIQALQICQHDALLVMVENLNWYSTHLACAKTQAQILADFDPTLGQERFSGSQSLAGEEYNRCYHAMVNYLTAVLVRVILQSIRGDYWINNIIAVIARISAKMKVIGNDLLTAVEQTLQNGREARARIKKDEERNSEYLPKDLDDALLDDTEARKPITSQAGRARKYFMEKDLIHTAITDMLTNSLAAFAVSNPLAPGIDEFESSITLYESLTTTEQILLCEQRDGGIGAASGVGVTRAFTAGFQVCLGTWETLEQEPTIHGSTRWTSIQWRSSVVDDKGKLKPENRRGAVKLGSMRRVIAATVPYAMISGTFSASLHTLIDRILFSSGQDSRYALLLVEQPKIICSAVLRTSQYESRRPAEKENDDACPVSETFMLQKRAVGHEEPSESSDAYAQTISWALMKRKREPKLSDREEAKEALDTVLEEYVKWVIDDNAIIISCKWYAWGTLLICALLVVGGLAVGFSLGERINGVDPFNISVFCWVLAGFVLLVAKAIRVENWPWSRFLRGQVTCRSISEVVAVSGVDAQLLIALLLRIDSQTYLRTRGPFNVMFLRHTDDIEGGFSIDVPIKIETAIEGGWIPIKILGDAGTGILFLSAHSWSPYNLKGSHVIV